MTLLPQCKPSARAAGRASHLDKRSRPLILALATLLLGALVLGGCSSSPSTAGTKPKNSLASDHKACSVFVVSFNDARASKPVPPSLAQQVISSGLAASSGAIRRAANQLQAAAASSTQNGLITALTNYGKACDALGLGPNSTGASG